jgi:UDP-N-acetylglucosamine diphosphorylase / glucose-1-phosphate thymidylyltransferase / UDP-N-acetylgalactosamine diphosphorylase / glucosamine-1-phosphate N-acetyltransferase / galactosamine-1-phosphate N-acetyltransferase
MIDYSSYVKNFLVHFPNEEKVMPWELIANIQTVVQQKIKTLSPDFRVAQGIAIHKKAQVEENVTLKGPIIINEGCFIGAHAYMRGGVFLGENTVVGPGCEVKSSFILSVSSLAHFNFVGDSLIGSYVNMEAGSVIANHFNERLDKTIFVVINKKKTAINGTKFGAFIGDHTKIGANAVLSPGTILSPQSIVKRLELVDQGG